ncbi:MAG: hypothetical protein H6707_19670 [Deltaproteobacteria bacterium]|nr:hypothetical protein [Deltaproteobacteria bacterium]
MTAKKKDPFDSLDPEQWAEEIANWGDEFEGQSSEAGQHADAQVTAETLKATDSFAALPVQGLAPAQSAELEIAALEQITRGGRERSRRATAERLAADTLDGAVLFTADPLPDTILAIPEPPSEEESAVLRASPLAAFQVDWTTMTLDVAASQAATESAAAADLRSLAAHVAVNADESDLAKQHIEEALLHRRHHLPALLLQLRTTTRHPQLHAASFEGLARALPEQLGQTLWAAAAEPGRLKSTAVDPQIRDIAGPAAAKLRSLWAALDRARLHSDIAAQRHVLEQLTATLAPSALRAVLEVERGLLAECDGESSSAAEAFRQAVLDLPDAAVAWQGIWRAAHREGDRAGQLGALKQLNRLAPASTDIRFALSLRHWLDGTCPADSDIAALEAQPNPVACELASELLRSHGGNGRAERAALRAIDCSTDARMRAEAALRAALAAHASGEQPTARLLYRQALDAGAELPDSLRARALESLDSAQAQLIEACRQQAASVPLPDVIEAPAHAPTPLAQYLQSSEPERRKEIAENACQDFQGGHAALWNLRRVLLCCRQGDPQFEVSDKQSNAAAALCYLGGAVGNDPSQLLAAAEPATRFAAALGCAQSDRLDLALPLLSDLGASAFAQLVERSAAVMREQPLELDRLLKAQRADPRVLAESALARGDDDVALSRLQTIIAADISLSEDRLRAFSMLAAHDRWSEALREYLAIAETTADEAERAALWHVAALALEQRGGDLEGLSAAELFERATRVTSYEYRMSPALGRLRQQSVDVADLRGFAEVCSESERAAVLTRASDRLAAAHEQLELLDMALAADPKYLAATLRARRAALAAEKWPAALAASRQAAERFIAEENVAEGHMLAAQIAETKTGDVESACNHYRRVLAAQPYDRRAFEGLRRLLADAGRPEELATLLRERLEYEPLDHVRAELHLMLARLARKSAGTQELVKRHLSGAVDEDPENLSALEELARLHQRDSQWPEAADALERAAELTSDPDARLLLWRDAGVIAHDRLRDPVRATTAFERALAIDNCDVLTLSRLSDLYCEQLDYKRALRVAHALLRLEAPPARRISTMLKIAQIQQNGLHNQAEAVRWIRRVIDQAPDDLKAIGTLFELLTAQGDSQGVRMLLDRSATRMRQRLQLDPFDISAYRALYRIFSWQGRRVASSAAAQVLHAFGLGAPEDRRTTRDTERAIGNPLALTHDRHLFPRQVPDGFFLLFRALAQPLARFYRTDLRALGVGREHRVTDEAHPLLRMLDKIASDHKLDCSYQLYVGGSDPYALLIESGSPPAIVIGAKMVTDSPAELAFIAGRLLFLISRAMILPARLRPDDLAFLVAALIRQYAPGYRLGEAQQAQLDELTRQTQKLIPRRQYDALMPFALECAGPAVDLRSLGASAIFGANRAGLLTCGRIDAAINVLTRMAGSQPSFPLRASDLQGLMEVEELLRFAVSEDHLALRTSP